jgi:hypothetical protein
MRLEIYESDKLNFVELNTTGDANDYEKCHQESKYVDSQLFNLFTSCFETSNPMYEYYGPTKYSTRMLIPLKNELISMVSRLDKIKSKDGFVDFVGSIFLGHEFLIELEREDKSWADNWEQYTIKVKKVNLDLINIVDRCLSEDRTLWVIGY